MTSANTSVFSCCWFRCQGILLVIAIFVSSTCSKCYAQSSEQPPIEHAKDTSENAIADENNPLNFTVSDIKRNCTNIEGPNPLKNHPGWSDYQGDLHGYKATFTVKNNAVYSVYFPFASNVNRQQLEKLLIQFSNGQTWADSGSGPINLMHGWVRADQEAWCQAIGSEQKGFDGISIDTKAYKRIHNEDMERITKYINGGTNN